MISKTFYQFPMISSYEKENRNFIIKRNLGDKLRTLRIYLLNSASDKFYYDIIIPRFKILPIFDNKRKEVFMLKASMGLLNEKEL